MLDSTMPPDLANEIRKLNSRIERLEMSARSVNAQRFIQMFPSASALTTDTTLVPQGAHASYTDMGTFTNVLAGDFMSDGRYLYGAVYLWMPPGNSMEWRIRAFQYGKGHQTLFTSATIAASGQQSIDRVEITDAVFLTSDRRNKFCRLDIDARRVAGAGRVGIGIANSPYTYPY